MQVETEKIICDILKEEMQLTDDQIWIFNQDFVMPQTSGLFVIVGMSYSSMIANNNNFRWDDAGGMIEVQTTNVLEYISINLVSKDKSSRVRKHEVLLALASYYSQQMQEKYNFKIAKIPETFVNSSDAEGSTTLNRYTITIPCYVWYEKEKQVSTGAGADYFDKFESDVIIDNNGEFSFNIGDT